MRSRLIVHGGAWDIPDKQEDDCLNAVGRAVREVSPLLQRGLSALDAVEMAVRLLEEDPALNAGRGAVLNADGQVELDAMIMDGRNLRIGAVGAVPRVLHPVTLSRAVMERTEHCFLVGQGALEFARAIGMVEVPMEDLVTERELAYYRENVYGRRRFNVRPVFTGSPADTVGAVALDESGNVAAATSTGGTPGKLPGRVGDSPIIGAGSYADNALGGISATGHGEAIMRVLLSKMACDLMAVLGAQLAVEKAIAELGSKVQGTGGLIGVDRSGRYGWSHSTAKMALARAEPDGQVLALISCLQSKGSKEQPGNGRDFGHSQAAVTPGG